MGRVWVGRNHSAAARETGRRGLLGAQAQALVRIQLEQEGVGPQSLQPVVFLDGICKRELYLASAQAWVPLLALPLVQVSVPAWVGVLVSWQAALPTGRHNHTEHKALPSLSWYTI